MSRGQRISRSGEVKSYIALTMMPTTCNNHQTIQNTTTPRPLPFVHSLSAPGCACSTWPTRVRSLGPIPAGPRSNVLSIFRNTCNGAGRRRRCKRFIKPSTRRPFYAGLGQRRTGGRPNMPVAADVNRGPRNRVDLPCPYRRFVPTLAPRPPGSGIAVLSSTR